MDNNKQLRDFLDGKLSEQEAERFLHWFLSEGGKEKYSAAIDDAWDQAGKSIEYKDLDVEKLLKKTNLHKHEGEVMTAVKPDSAKVRVTTYPKNKSSIFLKVAASIALVFSVAIVAFQFLNKPTVEEVVPEKVYLTKSNPSGTKTKIRLPDGSLVFLNSESSITYPKDFVSDRKVVLKGEAFFNVQKDSLHPFEVKSHRLTTVALGTSFNIKAFPEEDKVQVVLATGKVNVSDELTTKSLLLEPGEGTSVHGSSENFKVSKVDVEYIRQWTHGVLEFRKTPFKEIISQLERWYGVKIQVEGEMTSAKGSGRFRDRESLDNVLNVLSYSVDFDFTINDDNVKIAFK